MGKAVGLKMYNVEEKGVGVFRRLLLILMLACVQLSAMSDTDTEANEKYYQELPISESDKRAITKLITTMAEKNVVQLGFKKKSLEKLGDQIYHVHPMRFFGYVFSEPDLLYGMYEIKKSYFKWENFIDGMSKKCARKQKRTIWSAMSPALLNLSMWIRTT